VKPVLVGIAPSRPGAEGQPLTSLGGRSTGATLAELAGLSNIKYLHAFDRVNLCPTPRPSTILITEGRPMAQMLAGSLLIRRTVVLLGANVAECFGPGARGYELLKWTEDPGHPWGTTGFKDGFALPFRWAVLPHPSGRNHWYNDPVNRNAARSFMRELVNE
jgi:hypothetical protein